jgi:hypothetical protein
VEKAQSLGVEVIDENEFVRRLGPDGPPPKETDSTSPSPKSSAPGPLFGS